MTTLAMRVMTWGNNDTITRAVLQRQVAQDDTLKVTWEDVRELEVLEDGTVVLSRSDERIRTIEI